MEARISILTLGHKGLIVVKYLYLDEVIHERHLTVFLDLMKRDSVYHRLNEPTITRGHHHSISDIKKRLY